MDATDGRSRLLEDLRGTLSSDSDVEFAVTFGSRVSGESRSSSDLDVGVKFASDLSTSERFRKRCFLAGSLQRADGPYVDVVDIEALPVDVANDAVQGALLCGDESAFEAFKAEITAAFEEQREEIRHHQRSVIDRIAKDGLHG